MSIHDELKRQYGLFPSEPKKSTPKVRTVVKYVERPVYYPVRSVKRARPSGFVSPYARKLRYARDKKAYREFKAEERRETFGKVTSGLKSAGSGIISGGRAVGGVARGISERVHFGKLSGVKGFFRKSIYDKK